MKLLLNLIKTKVYTVDYQYIASSDDLEGGFLVELTITLDAGTNDAGEELKTELVVTTSIVSTNYTGTYLAKTDADNSFQWKLYKLRC